MRIVFMGTPDFAVPSLERLVEEGYPPIAVVTAPDRPSGRGQKVVPSAVKVSAQRLGVDRIIQPASVKDPTFAEEVQALLPDIIVVVAFKILPPAVFEVARLGAVNLHGSLLPKYRGAAPIHHAVLAGDRETGVTTFFLKTVVDTGDLILQREMDIGPNETTGEVHDRMMWLGAEAVIDTVKLIEAGNVRTTAQDDSLATPAPKIYRDDGRVDWNRPATDVHNHIRGMSPRPGAFTTLGGKTLKLLRSTLAAGNGRPGQVLQAGETLVVACANDAVAVTELQLEGRRQMPADEFLRGYTLKAGDLLG